MLSFAVLMQDRDFRAICRALKRFRCSGQLRYPAKLREQITRWVVERRQDGDTWSELARRLEMPVQTLVRWAKRGEAAVGVVPVEVVDDEHAMQPLVIVAPSGLRIEGATVSDAITIVRALS